MFCCLKNQFLKGNNSAVTTVLLIRLGIGPNLLRMRRVFVRRTPFWKRQ